MSLTEKLQKLNDLGYMATIPINANHINVYGFLGKYYKVKSKGSNTIVYNLFKAGFFAYKIVHHDGYHDIFVK
jgi:hypothetical protein